MSRPDTADRAHRVRRALCSWLGAWLWLASPADVGLADDWAEPMPLAASSLLLDLEVAGPLIIAVGERGHILLSSDRGDHWQQVEVPTRSTLTAVWIDGRDRVWAVGHDGLILRSQDGGLSWARQRSSAEPDRPLLDVWFADSEHGIAIGAYGLMLSTEDGGATWRDHGDDDGPHANAIAQAPDGALYIAGEFGTISRSDDRGRTWQRLASPYEGSFFGILALDDGAILVFGLRGHLFRSDDRGTSWQRLETGTTATLLTGLVRADGSVAIAGSAGVVLLSDDRGRDFRLQDRSDRRGIAALIELGPTQLLGVGDGGLTRIPVREPAAKTTANADLR
jgi:photosystem II stability/assembly factor-like uncharacterized protein